MHAVTTQQFLHGDCIDFSLVAESLHACMHAGLRDITSLKRRTQRAQRFKGTERDPVSLMRHE